MTENKYPHKEKFDNFPLGTIVMSDISWKGLHKVTGYLVGTYRMSTTPWVFLACERVYGRKRKEESDERYAELQERLVHGTLPPKESLHLHNVGGYRSPTKLDDVNVIWQGHSAFFYWGEANWIYHYHSPSYGGYHEPPEPEDNHVYGVLGHYNDWETYYDLDDDEKAGERWMLDAAWYMRRYLEKRKKDRTCYLQHEKGWIKVTVHTKPGVALPYKEKVVLQPYDFLAQRMIDQIYAEFADLYELEEA